MQYNTLFKIKYMIKRIINLKGAIKSTFQVDFKRQQGRQKINYKKLTLYELKLWKLGLDLYILKYYAGCDLPTHIDPINGKHLRLNVKLNGKAVFECEKQIIDFFGINLFRPDKYKHRYSLE